MQVIITEQDIIALSNNTIFHNRFEVAFYKHAAYAIENWTAAPANELQNKSQYYANATVKHSGLGISTRLACQLGLSPTMGSTIDTTDGSDKITADNVPQAFLDYRAIQVFNGQAGVLPGDDQLPPVIPQ